MGLGDLRKKIDALDGRILGLLARRFECALRTRAFKAGVEDPKREDDVLRSVERRAGGLVRPEFAVRLYTLILAESKVLQRNSAKEKERERRNDHEDRHTRRGKDGDLARPAAGRRP